MTSKIASPAFQPNDDSTSSCVDDLLTLTTRERQVFYAGYRSGVVVGIDMGRRQRDDEAHEAWAAMAARIRRLGGPLSKPYSAMCELRGDPERAAAARLVEQALGVAS